MYSSRSGNRFPINVFINRLFLKTIMSRTTIKLTDELYTYLLSASVRETDIQRELRDVTASHPLAMMQIAPEQGQFMALLVRLMKAKNIIEIGVFTGYSTLSMALAMPAGGQIIACDIDAEATRTARQFWEKAGVADRIDLRLGPAIDTLDKLLAGGQEGQFDFAFIDAEKTEYIDYYERVLELLKPGSLIAIDNVLWSGKPADETAQDRETTAIRRFNSYLFEDDRVIISMLPLGDGLTLALKL
jgi:predicted O-methyltransferase YrrM